MNVEDIKDEYAYYKAELQSLKVRTSRVNNFIETLRGKCVSINHGGQAARWNSTHERGKWACAACGTVVETLVNTAAPSSCGYKPCPKCRRSIVESAVQCPGCKDRLPWYCPSCGCHNHANNEVCVMPGCLEKRLA